MAKIALTAPRVELKWGAGNDNKFGLWVRISNLEDSRPGDKLVFRHQTNRHSVRPSASGKYGVRRKGMARIIDPVRADGTLDPWFEFLPPVIDLQTVASRRDRLHGGTGLGYGPWHLVADLSDATVLAKFKALLVVAGAKFYWRGKAQATGQIADSAPAVGYGPGRHYAHTVVDAVVVRESAPEAIVAQSNAIAFTAQVWRAPGGGDYDSHHGWRYHAKPLV